MAKITDLVDGCAKADAPIPHYGDPDPDPGAFHEPTKMQVDAMEALDDPGTWLTFGYSAALHLRLLMRKLGLWDDRAEREFKLHRALPVREARLAELDTQGAQVGIVDATPVVVEPEVEGDPAVDAERAEPWMHVEPPVAKALADGTVDSAAA